MGQETQDFRHLIGDVEPLRRGQGRADPGHRRRSPSEAQLARRRDAEAAGEESNFLTDDFVEPLGAWDPLSYRGDGIQTGVMDRLRQGGYAPQAQLHLIKVPLERCRRELFGFIRDAEAHDLRCLLIVHGRGSRDDSPANLRRAYLDKWLRQFASVQAFASAQSRHGGLGATYVLLRKSERARAANRERQQKRRG